MKKSALLVALSAASLASGIAFAQAQSPSKPYSETRPEATKPPMGATTGEEFTLAKLDKNGDRSVDREEAKSSPKLSQMFDKADTNKDGKLNNAELTAAAQMPKAKP